MRVIAFGTKAVSIIRSCTSTSKYLNNFDIKPENPFGHRFPGNEIKVDPFYHMTWQGVKGMIALIAPFVAIGILYIDELE